LKNVQKYFKNLKIHNSFKLISFIITNLKKLQKSKKNKFNFTFLSSFSWAHSMNFCTSLNRYTKKKHQQRNQEQEKSSIYAHHISCLYMRNSLLASHPILSISILEPISNNIFLLLLFLNFEHLFGFVLEIEWKNRMKMFSKKMRWDGKRMEQHR